LKSDISTLSRADLKLSRSHILALIETITRAGALRIQHPFDGSHIVLINPEDLPGFRCVNDEILKIKPGGSIVPENRMPVEIDYFGLLSVLI